MNKSLEHIFGIAEEISTVYGTPLYAKVEDCGQLGPEYYKLADDGTKLELTLNGKTTYISIRTATVDAGFDDNYVFDVGIYEAVRDGHGELADGSEWSVTKGTRKQFAV